ncbi:hypothetical protein MAR_003107 [Mya arenaria]|uniref:Uncharacterized protein n=1 Tax=Mya arenaria TaxID=6604 RepID=A0ABY7G802_MYAAR|nr:hypothetical protein MAR_003107 [Mya arenaria]
MDVVVLMRHYMAALVCKSKLQTIYERWFSSKHLTATFRVPSVYKTTGIQSLKKYTRLFKKKAHS